MSRGLVAASLLAILVAGIALAPPAAANPNTVVTLVVVDGSQSGSALGWFKGALQDLDTRFPTETQNGLHLSYGLLVADPVAMDFNLTLGSGGAWGSLSDLEDALDDIDVTGTTSMNMDGFLGIVEAIQSVDETVGYGGQNVILLTSGEWVDWGGTSGAALGEVFGRPDTYVNAIVDHGFGTTGPDPAMGARGTTTYLALPGDAVGTEVGVTKLGGPGFAYADFVLINERIGSVWDVDMATDAGTAGSFRRGFTDVKVAEFSGAGAPLKTDTVIPEPGTAALLGVAGGLLLLFRRRR
jgi:hypothetical protein